MKVLSILLHNPATVRQPTPDDFEKMGALIEEMKTKGVLIDTGGGIPNGLQMRVSRKDGKDAVTDGPFAQAKEVVGGFGLLEVADKEQAVYWTRRFLDLVGDATCVLHEVSTV